jgi:hypothetical protein
VHFAPRHWHSPKCLRQAYRSRRRLRRVPSAIAAEMRAIFRGTACRRPFDYRWRGASSPRRVCFRTAFRAKTPSATRWGGIPVQHYAELRLTPRLVLSGFTQLGCPIDAGIGGVLTFALGDQTASHPRVAFGGRSIDYQHLLVPLSRKPQALRQVASELVAQFGDPWPALWDALRSLYSPDEIEAARRLAPWLERADRESSGADSRAPSKRPSPTARS